MTVMLTECKAGMDAYLPRLGTRASARWPTSSPSTTTTARRSSASSARSWLEVADATTGLDDPVYRAARARCVAATRTNGIDRILADDRLDAIVAPAYGDSSGPAVSGYPVDLGPDRADRGRTPGRRLAVGRLPVRADAARRSRSTSRRPSVRGRDRPSGGTPAARAAGCRASARRPSRPATARVREPTCATHPDAGPIIGARRPEGGLHEQPDRHRAAARCWTSGATPSRPAGSRASGSRSRSSSSLRTRSCRAISHENEQLGMVITGSVTFTIGDETRELGPGGTWRIPSDTSTTGSRRVPTARSSSTSSRRSASRLGRPAQHDGVPPIWPWRDGLPLTVTAALSDVSGWHRTLSRDWPAFGLLQERTCANEASSHAGCVTSKETTRRPGPSVERHQHVAGHRDHRAARRDRRLDDRGGDRPARTRQRSAGDALTRARPTRTTRTRVDEASAPPVADTHDAPGSRAGPAGRR